VGARRLELVQGTESPLRDPDRATPARVRLVDAALECMARTGVAGTSLDDVARQAGCSRATVYRVFPGGKDALVAAVVSTEASRFFSALAVRMGEADTLEDVLVAGMTEAAAAIEGHGVLARLLRHEPEVVLAQLAFARMDEVLAVTCAFTAPFLGRWLEPAESRRVAEWAARIVVSYLACPDDALDMADPDQVRALVRTFVLPGIRSLSCREVPRRGGGYRRRSSAAIDDQTTDSNRGAVS